MICAACTYGSSALRSVTAGGGGSMSAPCGPPWANTEVQLAHQVGGSPLLRSSIHTASGTSTLLLSSSVPHPGASRRRLQLPELHRGSPAASHPLGGTSSSASADGARTTRRKTSHDASPSPNWAKDRRAAEADTVGGPAAASAAAAPLPPAPVSVDDAVQLEP